jgi:hypothetical protein
MSLAGYGKVITAGCTLTTDVNVYTSNPTTNNNLVAGDYSTLGTTALSTAIDYTNWQVGSTYNAFALNASGLSAISKTGVSKFGVRNVYHDAAGNAPTWSMNQNYYLQNYFSEDATADNGKDPKLVIAYTVPVTFIPRVAVI